MSEYRDNDNKEFLDLVDLVQAKLKGTNYKMYISIDEPDIEWDEDNPHEDWLDYDKYDKNPKFKNHKIDLSGWGQGIAILDPEPHKMFLVRSPKETIKDAQWAFVSDNSKMIYAHDLKWHCYVSKCKKWLWCYDTSIEPIIV